MSSDRITMLTLAASPEGTLEPGRTYRVPEDVAVPRALELVEGGYAVLAGGTLTTAAPLIDDGPPPLVVPPLDAAGTPVPSGAAGGDTGSAAEQAPPALKGMTVEQLRAYATENDIDLAGATKKAEILAAIEAAETGDGGGG
ncbi:Rho termination factor N-terminal domain-containing protein [Kitasatospora sp. NPDC059463]|uniref:Rho termination factor N-terminal domain-containing protein n=1 Tax=unclassified Kitasatospora TaxID=2633591 RepID=UPI0036CC0B09